MKFKTVDEMSKYLEQTELFLKPTFQGVWIYYPLKDPDKHQNYLLTFNPALFNPYHGRVKFFWGLAYQGCDFQEVLENSSPEVQEKLIFHLDLFG